MHVRYKLRMPNRLGIPAPPDRETPEPGTVRVCVRLRGGHSYELALPPDSPLLRELIELASATQLPARLVELPIHSGNAAATFRANEIVAVETTPPFCPDGSSDQHRERTLTDLEGPRIRFSDGPPITKEKYYSQAREKAQTHLDAFEQRRNVRQSELRKTCDKLGGSTFVVSAFNAGFIPLLRNWAASCDDHRIDVRTRTILFPTDEAANDAGRNLGFATCFDPLSYSEQPREAVPAYGGTGFANCVFLKLAMAQDMLELGYEFLLQDMDLVWFADPIPDLQSRAVAENLDFQFMRDLNPRFQPLYYNSGFLYARNNPFTRHTWQTIFDSYPAVVFYRSDQTVLNHVVSCFKERGLRTARLPDRYVDGQILAQADRGKRSLPPDRVVAHVNWTTNLAHKIERLKNLDLWYLD